MIPAEVKFDSMNRSGNAMSRRFAKNQSRIFAESETGGAYHSGPDR